jgi:hypothetical protein
VREGVAGDHLHVVGVGEDDLLEDVERPEGEFEAVLGELLEPGQVLGFESLADAAGQAQHGMDDFAAEVGDEFAQALAAADDFLAGLNADLADDADDVALLGRGLGADDKVGSAQDEDVQGVVFEHEGVIDQLADLASRRGGLDLVEGVEGFGGGHVMRGGADTADAAGDLRHVLCRTAEGEHLEAAQFGHLQVGAFDVALVIEEDVNLAVAFEAGDGINGETAAAILVGGVGAEVALVESLLGSRIHKMVFLLGQTSVRTSKGSANLTGDSAAQFPLTPALSPEEREKRRRRVRKSGTPGWIELLASWLPLLWGEGRGEGEQNSPCIWRPDV